MASFFAKFRQFPDFKDSMGHLDDAIKNSKKAYESYVKTTENSFVEFSRKQPEAVNDVLFKVGDKFGPIKTGRANEINNIIKMKEDFEKLKSLWDDHETKKKAHIKVKENCEKSKKNAEKAEARVNAARAKANEIELSKAENALDIASRQKQVDIANFEESERNMQVAEREYKVKFFQQILIAISNYAASGSTNSASLYPIGDDMAAVSTNVPVPEDPTIRDLTTQLQVLRAEPVDA